jgi:small GTP-binding protein
MLLFSGAIARAGEVHDGDTVTDFMVQERERGITIKAAAISFGWKNHILNLIDTPGHVDFTMEVERSMRVLDGSVLLYDAVNGVEAQSETVFSQAMRYDVAKIAFANKMDREGASIDNVAKSMKKRLGVEPLVLSNALGEAGGFAGAVDLISMEMIAHTDLSGNTLWRKGLIDEEVLKSLKEDKQIDVEEQYQVFLLKHEKETQEKYDNSVEFRTNVRGVKVRRSFATVEEAQVMAKVFQRKYPKDNLYIGKVGAWLPWDPSEHLMPEVEYAEKELNELMRRYKENEANKEIFFAEERESKIKAQKEENERRKRENAAAQQKALEDASAPVHPTEGALRE